LSQVLSLVGGFPFVKLSLVSSLASNILFVEPSLVLSLASVSSFGVIISNIIHLLRRLDPTFTGAIFH
ncbi:6447_t:CDS:2, partial [Gigaspora rosea]